jgi:homoaconitase/3-isopropylmalate dehydratase large subunit
LRIPKKKELLELQRKYRTDKKIGEVYGVEARLVTYWRTKKKIPAYAYPKYSEEKVKDLWERFGDDARAGEELNISKAGFRQWRRRYSIEHKPLQLRLEQLELPLPDFNRKKNSKRETIIQKLLAKKAGLKKVEIDEIVFVEPDFVISRDDTAEILHYFEKTGADHVWDSQKIAIALDLQTPVESHNGFKAPRRAIREFVKKQKIKNFFDVGAGVCHQMILENGLIGPGQLVLGTDSQSLVYGSIGAVASKISAMEMASIWASGRAWLRVPQTIRVNVNGHLARGVYARDIVLKLMNDPGMSRTDYQALEFYGPVIDSMPITERFILANLSGKLGCKAALIPCDDITAKYLRKLSKGKPTSIAADHDASYLSELSLDATHLAPQIGISGRKNQSLPVEEFVGRRVEQVILGCCSSGKIEDLEIAAKILRGRHVNSDVRVFVVPATRKVFADALEKGIIKTLTESGCIIMNPGCASCIDLHKGYLEPGDKVLTTSECPLNSNCDSSEDLFIGSVATAAATALDGAIADPRKYLK